MYKEYYVKRLEKKEFVSQANDEDVLIYNVRRVLPVCIPIKLFNQIILSLSPEDSNLLIEMYQPLQLERIEGCIENVAVLHTICYKVDAEVFDVALTSDCTNAVEKEILARNYNKSGNSYYLTRNYDDISDIRIARIFKKGFNYSMFDDYYIKLSKIFEKIDEIEKTDIFRGGMFVNTIHQFFYRKDYEHIPGMMIIEAARQFGYSLAYRFLGVDKEEVIFSLNNLNVKFYNYMQSNFPVYIQAVNDSKDMDFKKSSRDIGFVISFYQKDVEVSNISIYAKAIANKLFQRIRKGTDNDYGYRFVPGLKFQNAGYFINVNDQKKCTGKIKEVSLSGFIIKFENDQNLIEKDYFEFIIYIEKIGIIHGIAILTEKHFDFDQTVNGEFRIDYIDKEDKENLKEAIKRYTFLLDESIKD
jgi:hypothetical protein